MAQTDITRSSTHVSAPLTNLAIKYKVPNMVAERVFPVVSVKKEADKYYKFAKEYLVDFDTLRGPGAEAHEMPWDVSTDTYTCEEYALKRLIPKRVADNADPPVQPAMTSVQWLKRALMLGYEQRVQAIVQSAAVITNNAAAAAFWDAASGQDPEADVDTAKVTILRNIGIPPNAILMSYDVAQALRRWLKATAYTTYSEYLDKNDLPPILWGLEPIVAGAVYNTAALGQTESLSDVWNDNVLVFYKEESPSLDAMSLGYTMRSQNWITTEWYDSPRKGTFYEVSVVQDEELVCEAAGYLITNCMT